MFPSRLTGAVAVLLVFALAAPAQEKPKAKEKAKPVRFDQPVTVARGKDYLVHYLPPVFGFGVASQDAVFLHTTLSTGEMQVLFRKPPNAFGQQVFEVLGYVADRERLYIVGRNSVTRFAPGSGMPFAPEVHFHIYAFWLADGSELFHKELKEADVPEKLREKKPGAQGPIQLTDDGMQCFGVALKFDGQTVTVPAPKE